MSEMDPEIRKRIEALEKKFEAAGQDLSSYLDGLLHADYIKYWDYINLDTLLTLQQPKTGFPDEQVFIIYHQITELYFKLVLHEIRQISDAESWSAELLLEHVRRLNRYIRALVHSFDIMVDGMDKEQFMKFRMTLLPASGFQSAQYRLIELACTDLSRLVKDLDEEEVEAARKKGTSEELLEKLYWKEGATELATGEKTLTLKEFENKYHDRFREFEAAFREKNLRQVFGKLSEEERRDERVKRVLRELDLLFNIEWGLAHYKSAVRYLQQDPADIAATGGTNWQEYLPPRFQGIVFYPELWSDKEKEEWGKDWVRREVFGQDHG
ncbi:MAG: tryptophan 2,3-dioxygenase family protein [Flavobacteriales bacterium]